MRLNKEELIRELKFKAIRSSGSGGQAVNKVSSKIELVFNLSDSKLFTTNQKERLFTKLESKLTKDSNILIYCEETRSQHKNKALAIARLLNMLSEGLKVPKYRKPTKIPRAVIKKRIKSKRLQSERKANRKKPRIE